MYNTIDGWIHAPYPISTNRYWRRSGHHIYLTQEARDYKKSLALLYLQSGLEKFSSFVQMDLILLPVMTKKQEKEISKSGIDVSQCDDPVLYADCRRQDIGNIEKVLADALNGIAYDDDKQIAVQRKRIGYPVKDGGVLIRVYDCPRKVDW